MDRAKTDEARPRLSRRERRKQEVERRIREAARTLFLRKGYEQTTVEEIAERADVAKGTFFNYFPRKDSLLEAIAEDVVEELFEELGPPESWTGTAREQLLRLFLRLGDLVARNPELSKVMIIENLRNLWLHAEGDELEREFNRLIRQVLERGRARGELATGADVAMGAKLLEAAYFTTMVEWLRAGAPEAVYREQLTAKFDIIFRGLGRPEPAAKG